MNTPTTKHCNTCDTTKSVDEFYKDASQAHGIARQCCKCQNAYKAEWSLKNHDKALATYRRANAKRPAEYALWTTMHQRCENPNHNRYYRYGARGISVCARWSDFKAFIGDMGLRPSKKHTLDRVDNDKGYCPENCRWVSYAVNTQNSTVAKLNASSIRTIRWYRDFVGMTLQEIADEFDVTKSSIWGIMHGKTWRNMA